MDVDALSVLFRGAAINGGIILFSVICFYVVSSVLLLCSCVSLAHPRKKFNRGVCCGGSFWLMLETLNSALQVQINHNTLSLSLSLSLSLLLFISSCKHPFGIAFWFFIFIWLYSVILFTNFGEQHLFFFFLFLSFLLQFQSYQALVQSLTNLYDTNFNHSVIVSW